MPILKTAIAILAVPAVAAGYVTVMGTTGACSTCVSIMNAVTGGECEESTADVADSAGYIVGPPLGAALGAALGSRTKGLALSGLGVLAAVPATLALGS